MVEGTEDHGIHLQKIARFSSPNTDQVLLPPVGRKASTQAEHPGVVVKGRKAHKSLPLAQHVVEQGRKRPVLSFGHLKSFTDDGHLFFRELCWVKATAEVFEGRWARNVTFPSVVGLGRNAEGTGHGLQSQRRATSGYQIDNSLFRTLNSLFRSTDLTNNGVDGKKQTVACVNDFTKCSSTQVGRENLGILVNDAKEVAANGLGVIPASPVVPCGGWNFTLDLYGNTAGLSKHLDHGVVLTVGAALRALNDKAL